MEPRLKTQTKVARYPGADWSTAACRPDQSSDLLRDGHKSLPADDVQFLLSRRRKLLVPRSGPGARRQRAVYIRPALPRSRARESIESRDSRRPVAARPPGVTTIVVN